jgi:hypothetical protein
MKKYLPLLLSAFIFLAYQSAYGYESGPSQISSISFNSLYVDTASEANHFVFSVLGKKAANFEPVIEVEKAAKKSLEYFFLGLVFPEEKFWVNLNPERSDNITDPELAATDLGKIMLAADLRLKKDVSELTNPRTSAAGRQYWGRLYDKAEELGIPDRIPVFNRLWIVPEKAVVEEGKNQITIVENRLMVSLESEYFTPGKEIKNKKQEELQNYGRQLMRELILPELNKKVNESYLYADLREVYNALILARWYKRNFGSGRNYLLQSAAISVLGDLDTDLFYGREQIYSDYIDSLQKGEYDFVENKRTKLQLYLQLISRRYLSGGIDFRKIMTTSIDQAGNSVKQAKAAIIYSLDLFLSRGISQPLRVAKEQSRLLTKRTVAQRELNFAWEKDMPALVPIKSFEKPEHAKIIDRIVLNKL